MKPIHTTWVLIESLAQGTTINPASAGTPAALPTMATIRNSNIPISHHRLPRGTQYKCRQMFQFMMGWNRIERPAGAEECIECIGRRQHLLLAWFGGAARNVDVAVTALVVQSSRTERDSVSKP